ncbi:MAG: glucosamine-6-phosphate deaminase [Cyanobium sp.]
MSQDLIRSDASSRFELIELADPSAVAEHVAALLLHERRRRPELPLGLATGRTMDPIYLALARQLGQLPFAEGERLRERWLSFNLDEYVGLAAADPRSFHAAMAERLVLPLGLDPERVRLPDGAAADPDGEADRYRLELEAAGGVGLQVLGLGLNGHVGFNEPPCDADVRCRCVSLSASTRAANAPAFGGDPDAVPPRAITLGLGEILAARSILLVVTGAAKAGVLRWILQGPATSELPASWLHRHRRVLVVADRAALGRGVHG